MAANTSKHEFTRPIEEVFGSLLVKRATDITSIKETKLTTHVTMLSVDTAHIS